MPSKRHLRPKFWRCFEWHRRCNASENASGFQVTPVNFSRPKWNCGRPLGMHTNSDVICQIGRIDCTETHGSKQY